MVLHTIITIAYEMRCSGATPTCHLLHKHVWCGLSCNSCHDWSHSGSQ